MGVRFQRSAKVPFCLAVNTFAQLTVVGPASHGFGSFNHRVCHLLASFSCLLAQDGLCCCIQPIHCGAELYQSN